jgi:integrase
LSCEISEFTRRTPESLGQTVICIGCLTDGLEDAAKTADVEDVGVHTVRHSAAVGWLEAGVHIKAVADMLGNSSISITGDIYGHTSDDTARAASTAGAGCSDCKRQNHTTAYP